MSDELARGYGWARQTTLNAQVSQGRRHTHTLTHLCTGVGSWHVRKDWIDPAVGWHDACQHLVPEMKRAIQIIMLLVFVGLISGCGGVGYSRELRFFPGSSGLAPIPKEVFVRMDVIDGRTNYVWCTSEGEDNDEVPLVNMPASLRKLNPRAYWEYEYGAHR